MVALHISEAFVGAWSLVNITRTQNGQEIPNITYGANATGTIMYTSTGYMTALLTATKPEWRPESLTFPAQSGQTDAEWALIGKHSVAYSGPYFINETAEHNVTSGQVVHGPLSDSTLPELVNSQQRRAFTFHDNLNTLRLAGDLGNGVVDTLFWKRLGRGLLIPSYESMNEFEAGGESIKGSGAV